MKSIKSQILIYLVLVAVLIFSSLAYFSTKQLEKLNPYVEAQYLEIATARSDQISKELTGALEQVKMLSQSDVVQDMNKDEMMDFLTSVNLGDKYRNMSFSDIEGKGMNTKGVELDISEQEQFKEIILGDKDYWISDPFISPYAEENIPIITVSHVVKRDGVKIGLINAVFSTAFLDEVVDGIEIGESGFSWILDDNGNIVAHPSRDISIHTKATHLIPNQENIDKIIQDEKGTMIYTCPEGHKFMASFSNIKGSPGWTFIVSIPYEEAFSEISTIIAFFKRMTLVYFIIVAFLLYLYARTLSKPIENLKKVFERAANGDLNVKADEKINNELGEAGKSFNAMLSHIKNLTYRDPVTGLYNFNSFMLELPYKMEGLRGEYGIASISIISIDDFKRINSISGYQTGNKVLETLSKRILNFKMPSEMVARYFGDEIIVFLWEADYESLENRIIKLWQLCGLSIDMNQHRFRLKTSIGTSIMSMEKDSYDEVIHEATMAKLKVKNSGGNGYEFYNEAISKMIKEEEELDDAISKALEKEEFYLVYQPIVDITTSEIISNEALLRWDNESYGRLPIPVVIEFAERKGYIEDIGFWILKEACRQNKAWQDEGLGLTAISVNISVHQLEKPDFVDKVKIALELSNLAPEYLELEITETTAMENVNEKLATMLKLKRLGVKISIDDFGTGYSSLSYFTKFPIDTLKIDKSFVRDMLEDSNAMTIIDTIINMAKAMDVAITAEGVETLEHMEKLKIMGCDKIQGYYISKPQKAYVLEQMLKKLP